MTMHGLAKVKKQTKTMNEKLESIWKEAVVT
jgi:hypothetical protein